MSATELNTEVAASVETDYDIVVVGCGMAGLAAAIRAAQAGASVAMLEKSPKGRRGGQTRFTESFRVPSADTDLGNWGYEFAIQDYTREDFYADIMKQTNGQASPELARTLVDRAPETIEWLTDLGVEWDMTPLAVGYTAARTWFDGVAFVDTLVNVARESGVDVFYETMATDLLRGAHGIVGVETVREDERVRFATGAVIIAAGAYESSGERRTRYMGPDYDAMKVRGSRYVTGEAIDMALDVGAKPEGQWSGAHVALIDAGAPAFEGGANRVDGYQYGLLINHNGERFVDEGEDARAHTYAMFGRRIFEQPEHEAFIVLDAETADLVRATGPSDPVSATTLDALFRELGCQRPAAAAGTVGRFNDACDPGEFDPTILDGNATSGLELPKSNWAIPVAEPPFVGYAVTGGITFAFGGLATTIDAEVLDTRGRVIPGLYAAGNSVGGLFYDNYPGGTALTNAAVFGKIAGERAAAHVGP